MERIPAATTLMHGQRSKCTDLAEQLLNILYTYIILGCAGMEILCKKGAPTRISPSGSPIS